MIDANGSDDKNAFASGNLSDGWMPNKMAPDSAMESLSSSSVCRKPSVSFARLSSMDVRSFILFFGMASSKRRNPSLLY